MFPARGLAKCSGHTDEQRRNLAKKEELEAYLEALGIHEHGSQRETARCLGVAESTLRGWRNPAALDRRPPEFALDILRKELWVRIKHCG